MTAQHTPGRLAVHEDGEANTYSLIDADGKWLIALRHNGQQVTEKQRANMRRLAASWNACDGISTENLEDNQSVKELAEKYNAALAQRDELLAALNGLLAYFESGNSVPVSQATIKANSPEVIAARAAIAKVTGEQK